MADSEVKHASAYAQQSQAQNVGNEQESSYGTTTEQANIGKEMDAPSEAVKDRIDDAVAKGPKRADEYSGGRVQVAETGDLHDLAAKRQSGSP